MLDYLAALPASDQLDIKRLTLRIAMLLTLYIQKTKTLRHGPELFIRFAEPHNAISRSTFSRWIKLVLASAGVDRPDYSTLKQKSADLLYNPYK